jgi:hypothetical protein
MFDDSVFPPAEPNPPLPVAPVEKPLRNDPQRQLDLLVCQATRALRRVLREVERDPTGEATAAWERVGQHGKVLREAVELAAHFQTARAKNGGSGGGKQSAKDERPVTLLLSPEERERRIRQILQLPPSKPKIEPPPPPPPPAPEPEPEPPPAAPDPEPEPEPPPPPSPPSPPPKPLSVYAERRAAFREKEVRAAARARQERFDKALAAGEFDPEDLKEWGIEPPPSG